MLLQREMLKKPAERVEQALMMAHKTSLEAVAEQAVRQATAILELSEMQPIMSAAWEVQETQDLAERAERAEMVVMAELVARAFSVAAEEAEEITAHWAVWAELTEQAEAEARADTETERRVLARLPITPQKWF